MTLPPAGSDAGRGYIDGRARGRAQMTKSLWHRCRREQSGARSAIVTKAPGDRFDAPASGCGDRDRVGRCGLVVEESATTIESSTIANRPHIVGQRIA